MPKHRWRESIKSFLGSHIDPEKDEELKETKAEIDDKVQKILKVLKEDGERDGKEPLTNMIEDFHKQYESLYARYDHLTGELRKKAHGKHGKDTSSSSSSDSDSDYSPSKKGRRNGKLGNDFEKTLENVKQELEAANLEVSDLKRKLVVAIEVKESSDLECQGALDKIQATEKIIEGQQVESERWKDEKLKLLAENKELNKRMESAGKLEVELNQKLADAYSEKNNLILQKDAAVSQIEEASIIAEDLRSYNSKLKGEKEALQLELEATNEKLSIVVEKLESSDSQVAEVCRMQKAAEEENSSLSSKVLQLTDEIKQLQGKIQDLVTESSHLREKLNEKEKEILAHEMHKSEVSVQIRGLEMELDSLYTKTKEIEKQKEDEVSDLLKKLEDKEKDSSSQLEDLTAKIKHMQVEIDSLLIQKNELEEQLSRKSDEASVQIKDLKDQLSMKQQNLESLSNENVEQERQLEKKAHEISEFLIQVDALKEELANNSADLQRMLEDKESFALQAKNLELELNSLHNVKHELEEQLNNKTEEITQLHMEKESIQSKISEMERTINEKVNEISFLQKKCEDGETKASAQITALTAQVNNLQEQLNSLSSLKNESDALLEKKTVEILQYANQIESLKAELASKTVDRNRLLEEKERLLVQVNTLELELESLHNHKSEFEGHVSSKVKEINQLSEEKEHLQSKICELEKILTQRGDELFEIQKKLEDANTEASTQINNLTEEVNNLRQERDSLQNEKSQLELQMKRGLQESSASLTQAENQKNELANQIADQERKLKEQEAAFNKLSDEHKRLELLFQECKENLQVTQVKMKEIVEESEKNIEAKNQTANELANQIADQERKLKEQEDAFNKLSDEHKHLELLFQECKENLQVAEVKMKDIVEESEKNIEAKNQTANELANQIADQERKLKEQEDAFNKLSDEHKQQELLFQECKENLQVAEVKMKDTVEESEKNIEAKNQTANELANQIADQERKLKEQEDAFNKLSDEHKQLELLFQECKENLQVTEVKMKERVEESEKNIEANNQTVNELEEAIEDLKRDMEMKGDEVSTLVENVRTLEVKLRLANQKLRVTEQLLTANEESHKNKEEKLQGEQALLEERIAALSGLVADHKEAQLRLMTDVPEKVNDIMTGMDTFNMKFEEDYGHLESRIYEILSELKVTMNWIKDMNGEKEKLEKEMSIIVQQLKDEKEHGLVLKEKVGDMEKSLQKGEDEKNSLVKSLKLLEEKLGQLEKVVKEKDEMMGELQQKIRNRDDGILELGEEKREAIRQLCIWIEYHRSRYEDLKDMISKRNPARRQITA